MPPRTSSSPSRVAVLADSDTRWKWGALTARRIAPQARIDGLLLRGRATPTPRQLAEVGVEVDSVREVTGAQFVRAAVRDRYDVVILACVGGAVQAMLHGLARAATAEDSGGARRPVLVTGYVGIVYEKLADGLLLRHGADVVLANSRYDAERFRAVYEGVGATAESVVECALPFLDGAGAGRTAGATEPHRTAAEGPDPDVGPHPAGAPRAADRHGATDGLSPFTVTFAVQPSVPASRADRLYLLGRAARHARTHPEREVLIKLRSKPGEHTTHIEEQPYQKLAARVPGGLPANCRLVYGHMGEVLDRTDLLVTVSSTAALESLHRAVPTAVLTDLGIREVLGNHHFLGSGCLASWDQLDAGLLPKADPEWTARQGVRPDGGYDTAFDMARERVTELVARDELPLPDPYYSPTTAPGYLPGILARYGLAADGTPLAADGPAEDETGMRRAVRNAVREAARGAYRHGVQRVAPVIRRMGEL